MQSSKLLLLGIISQSPLPYIASATAPVVDIVVTAPTFTWTLELEGDTQKFYDPLVSPLIEGQTGTFKFTLLPENETAVYICPDHIDNLELPYGWTQFFGEVHPGEPVVLSMDFKVTGSQGRTIVLRIGGSNQTCSIVIGRSTVLPVNNYLLQEPLFKFNLENGSGALLLEGGATVPMPDTVPEIGFMTTIPRFTPRLFYVDGPRSMSFALTTEGSSMRVDYTARMTSDLCGLIWASEDTKDHFNLAYLTNRDYRGTIWSFDLSLSDSSPMLNDPARSPSLTIEAVVNGSPVTYIVALFRYADTPASRSSHIILNFDTLKSGFYADGVMDLSNVTRMFLSVIPSDYNGTVTQPLTTPVDGWLKIDNCRSSGLSSVLAKRDILMQPHGLGMCTSYDDHYDQSPERILINSLSLGYGGKFNHYCGMSIYPEKTWTGSRLEVIDPGTADVVSAPARKWHENYAAMALARNIELIYSVSYEIFSSHARYVWTQRDYEDNFGATGYSTPSYLLSPGNEEAMTYLKAVFVSFGRTLQRGGLPVVMQVGEPWWWYNPGTNKPCVYDYPTRLAFNAATGLYAPEFTSINDTHTGTPYTEFKTFLRDLLGASVQSMRAEIKRVFPTAKVSVLPFFPTILGKGIMEEINYPLNHYKSPNFDFFQIESYDWLIEDDLNKANQSMDRLVLQLGYPKSRIEYLAGFAPADPVSERAPIWKRVLRSMEHNSTLGIGKQYVWAYTLIMRDSIVFVPKNGSVRYSGFFFDQQYTQS